MCVVLKTVSSVEFFASVVTLAKKIEARVAEDEKNESGTSGAVIGS